MFQTADVEINACPAGDLSILVSNRNALGQYGVVLAVGPEEPVLPIPGAPRSHALAPRLHGRRGLGRMQQPPPADARALFLCQPQEAKKRLAGVGVSSLGVTYPYAVINRFADRAVQALALSQGRFGQFLRGDVDQHTGQQYRLAVGIEVHFAAPGYPAR